MKTIYFRHFLIGVAACATLSATAQISFQQDRDVRDVIGWPSHRSVPVIADFNGDGIMDGYYGGTSCTNGWATRGVLIKGLGNGQYEGVFTPAYEKYTTQEPVIMTDEDGNYLHDDDGNYIYVTDEDGDILYQDVEHERFIGMENGLPLSSRGMASQTLDFNQDGLVDLLIANSGGNDTGTEQRLVLVKNLGNYTFEVVNDECLETLPYRGQAEGFNGDGHYGAVAIADYDHDGYPDILYMNDWTWDPVLDLWGSCTFLLHNKQGQGFEKAAVCYPLPFDKEINHFRTYTYTDVTIDEDGIEIPGGFTDEPLMTIKPLRCGSVNFVDFNSDGWEDIVINGWADSKNDERNGYEVRYYENRQDGTFQDATDKFAAALGCEDLTSFFSSYGSVDNVVTTIDWDQNGAEDLLLVGSMNRDKKQAVAFLNSSEEGILSIVETPTTLAPASGIDARFFSLADYNGDEVPDLITYGWTDYADRYNWTAAINESKGAIDAYEITLFDGTGDMKGARVAENSTSFGDFNSDGKLDIVCTDWTEKNDDFIPSINTTDYTPQAPEAPENVTVSETTNGNLLVEWEPVMLASGGFAPSNIYVRNKATGETRQVVPADIATGRQLGFARWGAYVSGLRYEFRGLPAGEYTVGVQSVGYDYLASPFTTADFTTDINKVSIGTRNLNVFTSDHAITVHAEQGAEVTVHALDGRLVARGIAGQSLSVEGHGAFVVKAGEQTAKVVK